MVPIRFLPILLILAGCGGVAWDTRVAENPATRLAMVDSVRIGDTTEMQLVGRWGNPLQKLRDGGNTDYIYRARLGDQTNWVIVTFQHGVAIAVKSSDLEGCRASFAPRVPGYGLDTPDTVKPVGWCANPADPYRPNGFWQDIGEEFGVETASNAEPVPYWPGVADDAYQPVPGSVK